jgi:hypothetical protein
MAAILRLARENVRTGIDRLRGVAFNAGLAEGGRPDGTGGAGREARSLPGRCALPAPDGSAQGVGVDLDLAIAIRHPPFVVFELLADLQD